MTVEAGMGFLGPLLTPGSRRRIGPLGSAARAVVGLALLADVVYGHLAGPFRPGPWVLGLAGLPAVSVASHWWYARRRPGRVEATGPLAHVVNVGGFFVLYLMPDVGPGLWAASDAALVFYGASLVLAAVRGYAGCEVLAVSNWLLRRDDQVGCALFAPIDHLERGAAGGTPPFRPV